MARPALAALRGLATLTKAETTRVLTRRSVKPGRHEPQLSVLPRVSVVMPVLDEANRIERALAELLAVRDLHEIIVVDGGSQDRRGARRQRPRIPFYWGRRAARAR